jgi:tellurite resistance protein
MATSSVTTTLARGRFNCPRCASARPYRHRAVVGALSLPRAHMKNLLHQVGVGAPAKPRAEYIECSACKCTYNVEILLPGTWVTEAEHHWACKRLMVLTMMADGHVTARELDTVTKVYEEVCGHAITWERIRAEIHHAIADKRDLMEYLAQIALTLNPECKRVVLRSAVLVAAADGEYQEEELALLAKVCKALEIPLAEMRAMVDGITLAAKELQATTGAPPPEEIEDEVPDFSALVRLNLPKP